MSAKWKTESLVWEANSAEQMEKGKITFIYKFEIREIS